MPFKSDKIKYGLPHQAYPQESIVECIDNLRETIHIDREPVAITLLFTEEDYNNYPVEEFKHKMAYCQMVKAAAVDGRAIKCRVEHHTCDGATTALALEPSTERIESGQEYFSYQLYSSVATARRHREAIKSLHRMPVNTWGVAIVPLKDCVQTPDVIIMVCNAYQAMRVVQGYTYFTGKKPAVDLGGMQAMCSELTVSPYLTGEMNVSVFCPSTRMLCMWDETDMAVAIPYEKFEMITDGVVATVPNY